MTAAVRYRTARPDEKEMRAAMESSRQLTAFLSAKLELSALHWLMRHKSAKLLLPRLTRSF
jgi:hypothetical protein